MFNNLFVTAVGVSLTYVCSATILRQICSGPYKKWLRICISLQSSCLSFAGFTYPYLIAYVNEIYSLPGVFLLLCGFLLNNVCVHLLFFFAQKDHSRRLYSKKLTEIIRSKDVTSTGRNKNNVTLTSTVDGSTPEYEIYIKNTRHVCMKYAKFTNQRKIIDDVEPVSNNAFTHASDHYIGFKKFKDELFGHFSIAFVCVLIASSLSLGTEYSFLALYIDILKSKGISNQLALNAYIPMHVCALTCRLLPGLSNKLNTTWLLALFSIGGSIGQIVILISENYYLTLFGVGLSGMTLGGVVAAGTIEVANSVSKTRFPVAFGQILTGSGIVATSVSPLYGALRDSLNNYDIVLVSTAIIQLLSGILFGISWFCKRKSNNREV